MDRKTALRQNQKLAASVRHLSSSSVLPPGQSAADLPTAHPVLLIKDLVWAGLLTYHPAEPSPQSCKTIMMSNTHDALTTCLTLFSGLNIHHLTEEFEVPFSRPGDMTGTHVIQAHPYLQGPCQFPSCSF